MKSTPSRIRKPFSLIFLLLAIVVVVAACSNNRRKNPDGRLIPTISTHAVLSSPPVTEPTLQHTDESIPFALRALPLAAEAHVANPNLFVIAFREELGLAVGSDGTILRSTDAGRHWNYSITSTEQPLSALSIGEFSAIAVGMRGTILVSTDHGRRFEPKNSGTDHELRAVARAPKKGRVIAVGDKGVILSSADEGRHWTQEDSTTQSFLGHVVPDPHSGRTIVAGEHGTILVSSVDGNWQSVPTGIDTVITALEVRPDGVLLAATESGPILRSVDSGDHWSASVASDIRDEFATAFASDPLGRVTVATTRGGRTCRSLDAGETWSCQTLDGARYLNAIAYVEKSKSFVVIGDEGGIWTYRPEATSWERSKSLVNAQLEAVAVEPRLGSVVTVGHGGAIQRSEDGGNTWEVLRSAVEHYSNGIAVSSSGRTIIAAGTNGRLSRSSDAGSSYTTIRTPAEDTVTFFTVVFHRKSRAWLVGGNGNTLFRSNDDGLHWQTTMGPKRNIGKFHVHTDGTLFALTIDEGVLRSTDSGQSWATTDVPDGIGLTLALTLTSNKIVAVGRRGAIYDSEDGGQHFVARLSGSDADLVHIAEDPGTRTLWAVGARGTILTSSDQGLHWRILPSGTEESLNQILLASPAGPIVVGNHGTVLVSQSREGEFRRIPVDTTEHLRSIERDPNSQRLVAVGKNGVVLVSKDGRQWQHAFSHSLSRFSSITVGDGGLIFGGDRLVRWNLSKTTNR